MYVVLLLCCWLNRNDGADAQVFAQALQVILWEGRQHDMQRTAAFVKRLATVALHVDVPEAMAGTLSYSANGGESFLFGFVCVWFWLWLWLACLSYKRGKASKWAQPAWDLSIHHGIAWHDIEVMWLRFVGRVCYNTIQYNELVCLQRW